MGKTRAAYPPEFRRQMVDLVRAGRSPEELARAGTAIAKERSQLDFVSLGGARRLVKP